MPGKNEIVAGIRLEGEKEFKQSLTSINKEINETKSELKKTEAAYDGQANSLEALTAKNKILNKILEEQERKVEATKKVLQAAQSAYTANSGSVDKLKKALSEQQKKAEQANQAYDEAKQKLEQMSKEENSSEKAIEKQQKAVNKLEKELNKQNNALTQAKIDLNKGEDAYKRLGDKVTDWKTKLNVAETQLTKTNSELKANVAYLDEASKSTDQCAKSIDKFGKGQASVRSENIFSDSLKAQLVAKGIETATNATKELISTATEITVDMDSAMSKLVAKTGLSISAAKRYQSVMKSIKGDNFGESYEDVANAMSQVIQIMGELDDSSMIEITESAIALRDTFDMDINESIRAASNMMKTMGVSATEAFDLIGKGAQNGLDRSGELADNLTEYSSLWGQAGFSAEEMFAILENGLNAGAFNLDKVNDFVKEFGNSLADGRIEENLSSFSDKSQSLFLAWKNSKATTSEVFYSIISDLENMTNQQEALSLASDIWSALGEDNAMTVLTALNDTNDGYKNVLGTMEKIRDVRYDNVSDSLARLGETAKETFIAPIAEGVAPILTGLFNGIADNLDESMATPKSTLESFVDEIEAASEEVQNLLQSASDTMTGAETDVSGLEAYKNILIELNSQEKLTEYQKYQLASAVQTLGDSVPGLADAFDKEKGILTATNEELKEMFDNAESLAMQNAILKAQQDSYDALAQATLNKARADSALETAEQELIDAQKELDEKQESWTESSWDAQNKVNNLSESVQKLKTEQKDAVEQMETAQSQIDSESEALTELASKYGITEETIDSESEVVKENSDTISQNIEQTEEQAEAAAEAAKKAFDAAEEQKEAAQTIVDAYTSAKESIQSSFENKISLSDMFEKDDGGIDLTVEQMTENLQSQVDAMARYKENMQTVVAAIGDKVSPEFMQYIQDMGMEGANTLEHMVKTLELQGDGPILEMAQTWGDAMNLTDEISSAGAANQTAMSAAAGEFGSTAEEWGSVWTAITAAGENGIASWSTDYSAELQKQVEELMATAQQSGVKIPDGLAEGIASGEISPKEAINKLSIAIQGQMEGLAKVTDSSEGSFSQIGQQAGQAIAEGVESEQENISGAVSSAMSGTDASADDTAFEALGQNIGKSIASGIESEKQAIHDAISSALSAEGVETGSGFESLGAQIVAGIQEGITTQQDTVSQAAASLAQHALDSMTQKKSAFKTVGIEIASLYGQGITAGTASVQARALQMATNALSGANSKTGSFTSVGFNMSAGVAAGILAGQATVIAAAVAMATVALATAKAVLGIHSPSVVFRKDVGQRISEGVAFGIKDKASLASKQATKMSAKVYSSATSWLSKYKKTHKVSLEDEKWYWQEVLKHTKKGTTAYKNATKQLTKTNLTISTGSSALANKIASDFGVSKTKKSGNKTVKKSTSEYYSDIYSAAEKYLKNYQTLHNMSTQQEIAYWEGVKKRLKKGTQAWYDATAEINDLKSQLEQEKKAALQTQASVQDDLLDKYKVYYKVSAKAEMEYWNKARKQFKTGTDERIAADQKYLEACQTYYDERKQLDEDYAENSKSINEELTESVEELQNTYKDAVKSRKDDILSQMDLFEAWDSTGYDADTLLYNLKTQVAGLTLWEQQLEELGNKNISKNLLDELKEMGPNAAASIYSLNQMTAEQLAEYEKLWSQKNALAESQAVKDNEDLRLDTNQQITDLRTEAQAELNALNAEYRAALAELNTGLSSDLSNLLNQAGKIGEDAVSGLIGGIKKASDSVDVYNSTTQIVSTISSGLSELQQEGAIIGKETLDSLLNGMLDHSKIETASQAVYKSVKEAMLKNAQDEMQAQQEMLDAQIQTLNFAGAAVINDALSHYDSPHTTVVNVDTGNISDVISTFGETLQEMMSAISQLKVVLDSGELVGALQPEISKQTAEVAVRTNRGRL